MTKLRRHPFRWIALVALLLAPVCAPTDAFADNVDLGLTTIPEFNYGQWPWNGCTNCNKVGYVKVRNLGGVSTLSHLYAGAWQPSCPVSVEHIYAISCDTLGALGGALGLQNVSGAYVDWTGDTWPYGRKAAMRYIGAGASLCYRVDFGMGAPPGHAAYLNCDHLVEVRPASYDTDINHSNDSLSGGVNHGETVGFTVAP